MCILALAGEAQEEIDNRDRVIHIRRTSETINLDGNLDEAIWMQADVYSDFWLKFPANDRKGSPATYVQLTYDDRFLYVGVKVIETAGGNIVQSLKRDLGLRTGDGLGIVLDPNNKKTNGFYFAVTPFNSQSEGLITGSEEITFTWDNTWYSETKKYDGYWTAEIAIPFSILRYDADNKVWGINFIRAAREQNEFHTWSRIPLNFPGTDLGYVGQLVWDKSPPRVGNPISLNPYVITDLAADQERGQPINGGINAGLDVKMSLSSALNLDLTINPDFSNVDVDRQVTNLTRFNIFFPERRVFFLENDDLFSRYGIPIVRPFYSRRIGSKGGQSSPILFGARLTGNLSQTSRFGLMSIQTGRSVEQAGDNFTMATFNQRLLKRSSISAYVINRSEFQNEAEKQTNRLNAYGRNAGIESWYVSESGKVQGWLAGHLSQKPEISDRNIFVNGGGGYFGEKFEGIIDVVRLGRNYYADVGFVNRIENYDASRDTSIRLGQQFLYNELNYNFWPSGGLFNRITLFTSHFLAHTDEGQFNEFETTPGLRLAFKNTASLELGLTANAVELIFPFTFVDNTVTPLPIGRYNYTTFNISYSSDLRKNLNIELGASIGRFYNAEFRQYQATLNVRQQPYFSLAMNVEYNDLRFPEPYGQRSLWLIAPQIEVNFTNNLFWTSFLQWNTQADNFNINSRLQWRYKAMSDLFIVYTDNYFTNIAFKNKNRAIVLKANYWLNI